MSGSTDVPTIGPDGADYQNVFGNALPPATCVRARAGSVSAEVLGAELRNVRIGDVGLARRVYVAVRDHNWDTAPAEIVDYDLELGDDQFSVTFTVRHVWQDICLRWNGRMTGRPDGVITYTMDGEAGSDFRYNKIGLNIHHPLRECTGRPYRARTPKGMVQGTLPQLIEPQFYVNDLPTAMFDAYDELTIDYEEGGRAAFEFEGDLFEMQDHRNWTDGNFKTYGTPCQLGFPIDAPRGTPFRQTLRMSLTGVSSTASRLGPVRVDVRADAVPLPRIGLGAPSHDAPMTDKEHRLLQHLYVDHLRVDVDMTDSAWTLALRRGGEHAARLGTPIELAVTVDDAAEQQVSSMVHELSASGFPVARVFIFHSAKRSTPGSVVRLASEALTGVFVGPIAGGTNAYFAEINRDRPDPTAMDGVVFSINPQVHAFDDASLVETLPAQADTVQSARAFVGDLPLFVSPVTLRARFNPNATAEQSLSGPDELPFQVDPRQRSLFAAVWTLGSIRYLSAAGAAAVTYYETTGWRGVVETSAGSGLPKQFPSEPGDAFPIFHLLADVRDGNPESIRICDSEDPMRVQAVALPTAQGVRLLAGNMAPETVEVVVCGLPRGQTTVRRLNASTAAAAATQPLPYRDSALRSGSIEGPCELRLSAYELLRLDISTA